MPIFKVEIERPAPNVYNEPPSNPFLRKLNLDDTVTMHIRSWTIEAKDEAEIKAFFADAKEKDLDNVRGYQLRSIIEV